MKFRLLKLLQIVIVVLKSFSLFYLIYTHDHVSKFRNYFEGIYHTHTHI